MPRIVFEKKGQAVWISHLDLMRLFQRAFKRAGLRLTHTQGFNPRPSVSIALPLSVGVESVCELLDFDLDGEVVAPDEICNRLNSVLVPGVRVREVYETGRKLRDLAYLHVTIFMEYDNGIPDEGFASIKALFASQELIVPKKGKNGVQDQDIIPMIKSLDIQKTGERKLVFDGVICCQNPTLNPMQLPAAIALHLPQWKPDFATCRRLEIFDGNQNVFR